MTKARGRYEVYPIGYKSGYLKIIGPKTREDDGYKRWYYQCLCTLCNTRKKATHVQINAGIKSCGCFKPDTLDKKRIARLKEEEAFIAKWADQ